ncbi:MAG: hypothetical protein K2K57_06970, partial [Oscillospiraceae bacterium]|nr:hypothetical protein [Oscillospiraceae bacterium]
MTVSAANDDESYDYMSCQYYYSKPYIFYIGMNTSDKIKKSHDSMDITLSDKTTMTVWYEEDLKADIKDKAVTAALAEALVSCTKDNDKAKYPIIIGMENVGNNTPEQLTGQFYKDDNIGYFSAVFPFADKQTRASYLKKAYDDNKTGFFSVALNNMNSIGVTKRYGGKAYAVGNIGIFSICLNTLEDRDEAEKFADIYAEKAYTDGKLDFFSVITEKMDDRTLKKWYDRAEKDGRSSFKSICGYDNDDRDCGSDDWNFWDNEFAFGSDSETLKEYEKYGVTFKDGHYYYNGEPVRYFLDIQRQRSDSSFMAATVETNPKGKADVKIVRDKNGDMTGAEKLTEKEI